MDSPNKTFKAWTEVVLYAGYTAKRLKLGKQIRVVIAQQILYDTMIMLLELVVDEVYQ